MNNNYGCNSPNLIKKFSNIRTITLWAGYLGVAQSLIWMVLTIIGIVSYNCLISVAPMLTLGSLLQTVFLDLYFKGNCVPATYQDYNSTILNSVTTVLDPLQILIWDCVYLAVAVCWLLISVLLLTHVKKDNIRLTVGILYTWVTITFCISAMDLGLGIIFGIDYTRFHIKGYDYNFNSANAGAIDPLAAELLAGMVVAISMMIISLKGFILWIINMGLSVCLLIQTILIVSEKNGIDALFSPRKQSDDVLTTHPPINAYGDQKTSTISNNEGFIPDNVSTETMELNQEPIVRAARISTDVALQDRRFRNLDGFQQYPPPKYNNSGNTQGVVQDVEITAATTSFPIPDYSPPLTPRLPQNQISNGLNRNQRYQ